MDTTTQRKITLRQGKLVVFTLAAALFFQLRIKPPEIPYVYKSLQTTDQAEARQMAEDLLTDQRKVTDRHPMPHPITPRIAES